MVANFDNQFETLKARGIQNRIALHKQKCLDQAKLAKRAEKKANEIARAEYIKRRSMHHGKPQKSYDSYLSMANPNHEFETLKKCKVVKQAEAALESEESDSEEEAEDSTVVFVAEEPKTAEPKVEAAEAEWELL